jgi:hypothetical protein
MKYVEKILLILAIPYVLWHLYGDVLEYKNDYIYEELKDLELRGEDVIVRNIFGNSRAGSRCFINKTSRGLGKIDCIQNAKIKRIDIYDGSPVIYYRGQSDLNTSEMCEIDISFEHEIKWAEGELVCYITRFKTSEAYKIPVGRAATYARKLKEAKE